MQSHIEKLLTGERLDQQEAAILALGCIAEEDGSYLAIETHLDNLVPYLINNLDS